MIQKSKQKLFTCEFCRCAPKVSNWPRKYQWKTEAGYKNHTCYKDIAERQKQQEENFKEFQSRKLREAIENAKYKVGDIVFFWHYTVTRPTHENGRRVRYEEVRSYWAHSGKVEEIAIGGYMVGGYFVAEREICETLEEARIKSEQENAKYIDYCKMSSDFR